MIKSIFNLLLVLAICFTASMIPLDAGLFDAPLIGGNDPIDSPAATQYVVETAESPDNGHGPAHIEFTIKGLFHKDFSDDYVRFDFIQDGEVLASLPASDFDLQREASSEDGLSILAYEADLDPQTAGLSAGTYSVRISVADAEAVAVEEAVASVLFYPQAEFTPAGALAIRPGQLYFRLYYIDQGFMRLVPVTRQVPEQGSVVRYLINTLSEGPRAFMGLMEGSPIPPIPYIWISGTTATVSLPRGDLGVYDDGSSVSLFAADALRATLRDNLGITEVQVLVGQQPADSVLHGLDARTPWSTEDGPRAYIGLETASGRLVLAEANLEADSYDDAIEQMFKAFRTGETGGAKPENAVAFLPGEVSVLDYKISGGVMTMDLSADFTKLYGDRTDLAHLAVEALLNSFTTLQNVEKVSLTAKGEPIRFESYDFSAPLEKPAFINPEIR